MNFLDERLSNFSEIIENKFPTKQPVILLMDNINMYRGKNRHDRLYKSLGPKMWNFDSLVGELFYPIWLALKICSEQKRLSLNHNVQFKNWWLKMS